VAAITVRRQSRVVIVGVTRCTCHRDVRSGQWKGSVVVVERRGAPAAGGVANGAIRWKSRGNVIRIRRAVEIRLMARVTCRGCRRVVAIRVALHAGKCRVHPGQRVVGIDGVIEVHACPVGSCMAGITCGWKSRGSMAGVVGPVPIGLVTPIAVCGQSRVVVVRVALRAGHCRMRTGQRKYRSMIECGTRPSAGRVAQSTICWKTRSHVSGVVCPCEVGLVTPIAVRGQGRIVVIRVTLRAGYGGMRPGKWERRVVVIEGRTGP
jgi:hypothetical protein